MLGKRSASARRTILASFGAMALVLALDLPQANAAPATPRGLDCPVYCHFWDQYGRVAAFAAPFGNDRTTACSWGVCLDCGGLASADLDALEDIETLSTGEQFRLLRRIGTVVVNDEYSSLQLLGCDGQVAANVPVTSLRTLVVARIARMDLGD